MLRFNRLKRTVRMTFRFDSTGEGVKRRGQSREESVRETDSVCWLWFLAAAADQFLPRTLSLFWLQAKASHASCAHFIAVHILRVLRALCEIIDIVEIVKLRRYCLDSSRERTGRLLGAFGLNLIYFDLVTFSTILINFACPARVRVCVCVWVRCFAIYLFIKFCTTLWGGGAGVGRGREGREKAAQRESRRFFRFGIL